MKPLIVWPVAVLLSVAASFAVARFAAVSPEPAREAPSAEVDRLAALVAELDSRQASLSKSIEELRSLVDSGQRGEMRVPMGEIEAAVARALESPDEAAAKEDVFVAVAVAGADTARSYFDKLMAEGLSQTDKQAIWKEAADAGHLDELVAMFEERAKANPGSADAQLDLGKAYLQKVFKAGGGPEAGTWAIKADKSFDAALANDDRHWEARFSKAVSLSFWPPVFGKQTEAIRQFEILIDQQGGSASNPSYAQTWLLLGNMYQQLGRADQALETWQRGLALFPDNSQLLQQISNGQGH